MTKENVTFLRNASIGYAVAATLLGLWMFSSFGLTTATGVIGAISVVVVAYAFRTWRKYRHIYAAIEQKVEVAKLEAGLGVPLPEEGECRSCHHILVAGSKFCSVCGEPVEAPVPVICEKCGERQATYAVFCHGCGEKLTRPPVTR